MGLEWLLIVVPRMLSKPSVVYTLGFSCLPCGCRTLPGTRCV